MGQGLGVLAGILSSAFDGMAAGTTRFVIGNSDPITIGTFRFDIGFLIPPCGASGYKGRRRKR